MGTRLETLSYGDSSKCCLSLVHVFIGYTHTGLFDLWTWVNRVHKCRQFVKISIEECKWKHVFLYLN